MRRTLLLFCALLFAFGTPANLLMATDYYVTDNDGDTGGNGSSGAPYGSITQVLANEVLVPGDRILLEAGTWTTADSQTFPVNTSELQGVTIEQVAVPGGPSIIDGEDKTVFRINGFTASSSGTGTTFTNFPTIFRDLTLKSTNAFVFRAEGAPDDLRISSCIFSGASATSSSSAAIFGFAHIDNPVTESGELDDLMRIRLVNNTFQGIVGGAIGILADSPSASTGIVDILISGNVCNVGSGSASFTEPFGIGMEIRPVSHAVNLAINNNMVLGGSSGIGFTLSGVSGTFSPTVSAAVNGNTLIGQSENGISAVFANVGSGFMDVLLDVSGNVVSSMTGTSAATGIAVSGLAGFSAALALGNLNCGVMSNTVSGNSGAGVRVFALGAFNGAATVNLDIQYNCIRSNAMTGLQCFANAGLGGVAALSGNVLRNVVIDNGAHGVLVDSSFATASSPSVNLFFGNSAASPGYNTFRGNGTATGTWFDFKLDVSQTSLSVSAMCNWWGVTSSLVEGLICDITDNAALGNVIGLPAAPPTLTGFTADVTEWEDPGDPVVITAALGTTFLANVAAKLITVTMGGVPVTNLVVLGDTLSFLVPALPDADANIIITNPGGQTGVLLLPWDAGIVFIPGLFKKGGGGLCFVATAAFGDVDAPEVLVLRRWRDEHLSKNALGRAFVRTYYDLSPGLASAISESDTARTVSRAALTPFIGAVRLWMEAPWLMMLGGGMLVFSLLRRRK